MNRLAAVLNELRKQKQEKQAEMNRLGEVIVALSKLTGRQVFGARARRRLSTAVRRRIAAAQKVRWEKWTSAQKKKAA